MFYRSKVRHIFGLLKRTKKSATMNAAINETTNGYTFLDFFNSKQVYSIKGFETKRRAMNYAKKWGINVVEKLPAGVAEYENNN